MSGDGLLVRMARIPGLTDPDLLTIPYHFQCPPLEEFAVQHAFSFSDYDTVNSGQFSRRGGRQLRQVTFDSLAVDFEASWQAQPRSGASLSEQFDMDEYGDRLRRISDSGTPFRLLVTHQFSVRASGAVVEPELDMEATLRTLTVTERAGEPDTRYFNVSFVEWRDPVVSRRKASKWPVTITFNYKKGQNPTDWATQATQHNGRRVSLVGIRKPLTLERLARHFYAKPSLGRHIGQANGMSDYGTRDAIVKHRRFRKGGKLKVPAPPAVQTHSSLAGEDDGITGVPVDVLSGAVGD